MLVLLDKSVEEIHISNSLSATLLAVENASVPTIALTMEEKSAAFVVGRRKSGGTRRCQRDVR
jgi:hypothetical protein